MSKAGSLVRNLKSQPDKPKESFSEWGKCHVPSCPLQSSIKADAITCRHHFKSNGDHRDAVTEAIKENHAFINKLSEMYCWSVWDWKKRKPQIMGWPILPMSEYESERPNLYLYRLDKFIEQRIKDRATEILQHGL